MKLSKQVKSSILKNHIALVSL